MFKGLCVCNLGVTGDVILFKYVSLLLSISAYISNFKPSTQMTLPKVSSPSTSLCHLDATRPHCSTWAYITPSSTQDVTAVRSTALTCSHIKHRPLPLLTTLILRLPLLLLPLLLPLPHPYGIISPPRSMSRSPPMLFLLLSNEWLRKLTREALLPIRAHYLPGTSAQD